MFCFNYHENTENLEGFNVSHVKREEDSNYFLKRSVLERCAELNLKETEKTCTYFCLLKAVDYAKNSLFID